ncbi:hypothetical protein ABIB14_003733 [Arthrobacter sp. UYEF3]
MEAYSWLGPRHGDDFPRFPAVPVGHYRLDNRPARGGHNHVPYPQLRLTPGPVHNHHVEDGLEGFPPPADAGRRACIRLRPLTIGGRGGARRAAEAWSKRTKRLTGSGKILGHVAGRSARAFIRVLTYGNRLERTQRPGRMSTSPLRITEDHLTNPLKAPSKGLSLFAGRNDADRRLSGHFLPDRPGPAFSMATPHHITQTQIYPCQWSLSEAPPA